MIYGYIRVSHDRQASGLGLAAQAKKIQQHAKTIRGQKLARIYRDAAVSASKQPFLARPNGWALDQVLVKGDHVVFARLDRACRNLHDFAGLLERWHKRGVFVHLLDVGVDTSTPVGQLVAGIMASIAQWESQRIGERITATFQGAGCRVKHLAEDLERMYLVAKAQGWLSIELIEDGLDAYFLRGHRQIGFEFRFFEISGPRGSCPDVETLLAQLNAEYERALLGSN